MVALKLVIKVVSKVPTLKPGSHTSATIGDCKTKNVIEFMSKELPVRSGVRYYTRCPTNISDSH